MVKGSCNCGEFTYEFTGEPAANVICHCIPCLKTAGANGSTNTIVPDKQFKHLTGKAKIWTRKGDSGKNITYNVCETCGCIMYVKGEALGDVTIVKSGTVDGGDMDSLKPGAEIYTKNRAEWCPAFQGAAQKEAA